MEMEKDLQRSVDDLTLVLVTQQLIVTEAPPHSAAGEGSGVRFEGMPGNEFFAVSDVLPGVELGQVFKTIAEFAQSEVTRHLLHEFDDCSFRAFQRITSMC